MKIFRCIEVEGYSSILPLHRYNEVATIFINISLCNLTINPISNPDPQFIHTDLATANRVRIVEHWYTIGGFPYGKGG